VWRSWCEFTYFIFLQYLNKQWVNNISELQKYYSPAEVLLEVKISAPPYFKAPEVLGNSSAKKEIQIIIYACVT
jgi:hypothetical protein